MARRAGMSQTAVSRSWRAFGLRPHRVEMFKLSTDPAFVEKLRDVVGLYLNPPDRALVLCIDEKPQIQPAQPGAGSIPARAAARRQRRGTTTDRTGPADAPGADRAPYARLSAVWYDRPVCGPGHQGRHGHRPLPAKASWHRVSGRPRHDRARRTSRCRRSRRPSACSLHASPSGIG